VKEARPVDVRIYCAEYGVVVLLRRSMGLDADADADGEMHSTHEAKQTASRRAAGITGQRRGRGMAA